jgi:hypothetical protein
MDTQPAFSKKIRCPELQKVLHSITTFSAHSSHPSVSLEPGDLVDGIETSTAFEIRRAWRQGERWEAPTRNYLKNLEGLAPVPHGAPERRVKTHSLYHGDLFLADGKLYLVIGTAADGSRLAKPWANASTQIVALNRDSPLAHSYPVVEFGEPLPLYLKRNDLLDRRARPMHFRFLNEDLAFRAACLDQSLTYRAVLFAHVHDSTSYVLSDGRQPYRYYSYPVSSDDSDVEVRSSRPPPGLTSLTDTLDYTEGPAYWQFVFVDHQYQTPSV